ncbi:chemosensory receptor a [Plakobranchus ocellatus]|uniref:Chemosensory receptor a n=1 Tax=Plakobranchus ocellatus TaxID=259542 RepID=A0AAV4D5P0_9GAST|nr:chemosensory receptor a [Plakobranchus ocellatus]
MNVTLEPGTEAQGKGTASLLAIVNYLIQSIEFSVSCMAVCLNIINSATFLGLGLKDSSTVSFFALSLTDLISALFMASLPVFDFLRKLRLFDLHRLKFFLFAFFAVFRDTAAGITTYVAFQRALCVALPFFTRNAFNRKRSAIVICLIFLFYLSCALLRVTNVRFVQIVNRATNSSRQVLLFSDTYNTIHFYLTSFRSITLFLEQGIIIISIVVLANGLRTSRRLVERSGSKATAVSDNRNTSGRGGITEKQPKMAQHREIQAVQQCLAIAVFHVVYTFPRIVSRSLSLVFPNLRLTGNYLYLLDLISIADSINATAQFFIYMRFNRKYKHFVSSKFCPGLVAEN